MSIANNYWTFYIPEGIPGEDYAVDCHGVQWSRIDSEGYYYITDQGEVISFRSGRPKVLETWHNQHGHEMIRLPCGIYTTIHRLMAEHFIPNPKGYPIVRHVDDDPKNNCLTNLRWGTMKDNRDDMIRNDHDYRKPVYSFELDRVFRTAAEAADYYNVSRGAITVACQGKSHTVRGHHLCYLSDLEEKKKDLSFLKKVGNNKPVVAINNKSGVVKKFNSRKEASAALGVSDTGITNVLAGRIKQTGGWRFEEGE